MYITSKDISRTASILNFKEAHLKILKLQLSQNFLCHSFLFITENTKIFLEVEREKEKQKKIYIYTHTHTYMVVSTRMTKYKINTYKQIKSHRIFESTRLEHQ
jgi:hypothetical protein